MSLSNDLWPLGELTLEELTTPAAPREAPNVVQKMREGHHSIARLLAEGRKHVEVSAITGYSSVHISRLLGDPAFQDLLEFYREQVQGQFLDVHARLAVLGATAVQELQDRLDENGGEIPVGVLIKVAEMALDRSVAPKKTADSMRSGQQAPQISINFLPSNAAAGPIIDAKVIEQD